MQRFGAADGLSDNHVRAIAEDAAGNVWVGTSKGLNRITANGSIQQFHVADGLAGEQVRALFGDTEGTLWIGSTGGGLTRWKDGKLESLGLKEGLINEWIEQIVQDDHGYLWLGSNGGLMRVNLRQLNDCLSHSSPFVHCTVFRREEGLILPNSGSGFQPSALKTSDGKLWFASDAGIAIIDPGEVRVEPKSPAVYIEEVLVDEERQSIYGESTLQPLPAGTHRLEFRYTGLDSTAPALVRFRHKLEGFDSDWVNAAALIIEGSLGNSLSLITGGGGGGADALTLSLRVVLPPMRPNGSPAWFRSGELSLKITGAPSVSVVGEVTVEIEGDILTFFLESGISFPGPTLQLAGGLQGGGGWTSPFDLEWLTLNELIVVLGIDAAGSAKLGFTGDVIVGEKDIQVSALLAVNVATGVPTNLIFEGSSTEGFSLSDIAALQAHIASITSPGAPAIPLDHLPEMAVKNILLKIAPRPDTDLGIERGLAFAGDFYMQVQKDGALQHVAAARFKVGEGEISAFGEMISGTLGPITWRDPYLDLLLSRQQQHFMVGGYADVQFLEGDLDLALSREEMNLDLDARILDRWDVHLQGESAFNFETPNFPINGNMLADFLGNVTSDAKARFGEVADQGKTAIANAQGLVNDVFSLKNLKDLELGAKINTLINELDLAGRAMDAAFLVRYSALSAMNSAMNSARIARDAAWNLYLSTPSWQPIKAVYYADYLAKAGIYSTRYAAYHAANASYLVAKAAYDILPPIEQNPIIIALRRELSELSQLLELRRQQLSALRATFTSIIDAVQQGLITVENASFTTTLRDLIDTHKVTMRITLVLAGERQVFLPAWDFDLTIRENLKPVVDQILRARGVI